MLQSLFYLKVMEFDVIALMTDHVKWQQMKVTVFKTTEAQTLVQFED